MGEFEFVVSRGLDQGAALPFPGKRFVVGSGAQCGLRITDPGVAPRHLEIWLSQDGTARVRDLAGRGDVFIDGVALSGEGALVPGGFLAFGQVELVLREPLQAAGSSGTLVRAPATPVRVSRVGHTPSRVPAAHSSSSHPAALQPEEFDAPSGFEATVRSTVLPPGTVVDGRYEIVGKLAEGGMGEVYRARHVELGKQVALKVMRPELSEDPEFVARFKREAVAASQIGQQNIIDVSDFGRTQAGRFYFVMEYVDGHTLDALVREVGALPVPRAVNLVMQVARALGAAHVQGIVHRDLKPENVMVLQRPGQPDFVKVLDFGVAKVSRKGQPGQTAVGMVVGTPQYMAPEQAQGVTVDARSDIYALGLILFELLTGRPVFDAETPSMLMVKHVTEPPPPFPEDVASRVPHDLQELNFRMLEKAPERRPRDMEEVCAALAGAAASGTASAPAPRPITVRHRAAPGAATPSTVAVRADTPVAAPLPPPPSRLPWVLSVVGVLVLSGAGAGWLLRQPSEQPLAPAIPPDAPVQPRPVAAPAPQKQARVPVKLAFTSANPVTVLEDDVVLGTTPLSLERSQGTTLELTFRADGFKESRMKVRFESNEQLPVALERITSAAAIPAAQPARRPYAPPPQATAPPRPPEELKENPF